MLQLCSHASQTPSSKPEVERPAGGDYLRGWKMTSPNVTLASAGQPLPRLQIADDHEQLRPSSQRVMEAEVFPQTLVEELNPGAAAAAATCAEKIRGLPYARVHGHAGIEHCPDRDMVKAATTGLRLFGSKHWKVGFVSLLLVPTIRIFADMAVAGRQQ